MALGVELSNRIVLVKGVDKTDSIRSIKRPSPYQFSIRFNNSSKEYTYDARHVQVLHKLSTLSPGNYIITVDGRAEMNVREVDDFGVVVRILYESGYVQTLPKSRVKLVRSCLDNKKEMERFEYYKAIAHSISVRTESGMSILGKHYDRIKFIREDTMLASFLSGNIERLNTGIESVGLMFPFGFNTSQKKAVQNAIENKISVIEGPPGTGKTQTILSLIANLVPAGNKVAVVSNNNSAIDNVYEKLHSEGISFIAARLGRVSNKEEFISNQTTQSKEQLERHLLTSSEKFQYKKELFDLSIEIDNLMEAINSKALIKQEIREVATEHMHYSKHLASYGNIALPRLFYRPRSDLMLKLIGRMEESSSITLTRKIINVVTLGIVPDKFYNQPKHVAVAALKSVFYDLRLKELQNEESTLEDEIKVKDTHMLSMRHREVSMMLFKNFLSEKYLKNPQDTNYRIDDLWKRSEKFMQDYPVVLSTTHSLRASLSTHLIYDYVIIDEASQIDLATFALALSCAKNVVIVGDEKQLPNVIDNEARRIDDEVFGRFSIPKQYKFSDHSALSVIKAVFGEVVPTQMLREHYRCHPLIIGFCNKMFYNNELIILTPERHSDEQPLSVWYTAAGNHARSNRINQRQIDVTLNEVIPKEELNIHDGSLGIVSPYRNHADELNKSLKGANTLCATVDKFQGRERDVIILNTVDNEISDFVSNPNRLNVAVSRARNQLIVVTNGNNKTKSTGVDRLVEYIKYNNLETEHSSIRSIFDYLYKSYYTNKTKKARKDSSAAEDLMHQLLRSIQQEGKMSIDIVMEYPLGDLCDVSSLSQEEATFAQLSRVDFVVFDAVSKSPILAIEVDGYEFHKAQTLQAHKQRIRDEKKNKILSEAGMPLMRFSTTGSGEIDKISQQIKRLLHGSSL